MSAPGRKLRRKKMKSLIRLTSLCGTAALVSVRAALAQTPGQCAIAPTCGELGYEQNAADCTGQHMLKCPFDTSKVFCGGINCSYTNTSLPSGCANAPSCTKNGRNYFSSVCSSCYTGYSLKSDGTCSQTCTYNTSSTTNCTRYDSCQRGSSSGIYTYYKCTACTTGYYVYKNYCKNCEWYLEWDNGSYTCGEIESVRLSGPYTSEECHSKFYNGAEPASYNCGNKVYYYCKDVSGMGGRCA